MHVPSQAKDIDMSDELITWKTEDGTLTLLPSRGRVLQVMVDKVEAFWVNPEGLDQPHPGGDRAWAGPEIDWFWKCRDKIDFNRYAVPESLDPGTWTVTRQSQNFCQVQQQCLLTHLHGKGPMRIEMTRSFRTVAPPDTTGFTRCLAFQTENELRIVDGAKGQAVDFWSLLQVHSPGEMLISTTSQSTFQDYFGSFDDCLHHAEKGLLRFTITGNHQYKVGVPVDVATGRMAYLHPVGNQTLVIFRHFTPRPGHRYCDVAPLNRLASGDVVQIYNDGGQYGGFGEMEYHTAALTAGEGNDRLQDTSLTVVGLVETNQVNGWVDHWMR